ncbi:oxidoreductase [Bordetella sp. H567]|uniref:SDR family NAD(P)-dependent oxidoreductase n=1 Tax=Bordetella sp. H567 TaxID=1697043 RepID=UPI00081C5992|nr:SDR family oxidoreductase [Bordetella sp. H567]AOB31237.1 oxidoreductase [Bordetella sp. H567]
MSADAGSPLAGHALVTGACSGIGAAIAARLLEENWRVTGVDRAPAVIQAVRYDHIVTDLADVRATQDMARALPVMDAVVHAAGHMRTAPLGRLDPDEGDAMWRIHVRAPQVLLDAMAARLPQGARIVLIGSRVAQGAAGRSQYAAAKSALIGMARSWAAELAPRGITVNVVAPAATDTPMLRDAGRASSTPTLPPIGRFVSPREIAGLTAFLLGPDGGAITGQQVLVCGGASL